MIFINYFKLNKLQIIRSLGRMFLRFILLENGMYSNNIRFLRKKTVQEQKKMKEKYRSHISKKFNKHHHHEEFLLLKSINEKEALCPSCNHPLSGHKIRIPHHCTQKFCKCKLSRVKAKTEYFKCFMKERRNQKSQKPFFDLTST